MNVIILVLKIDAIARKFNSYYDNYLTNIEKDFYKEIFDEIITVTEEEAFASGRKLASSEGILAGITSGASLFAAKCLAERPENKGKTIVTLLPDTGERYLSTDMF